MQRTARGYELSVVPGHAPGFSRRRRAPLPHPDSPAVQHGSGPRMLPLPAAGQQASQQRAPGHATSSLAPLLPFVGQNIQLPQQLPPPLGLSLPPQPHISQVNIPALRSRSDHVVADV